MGCAACGGGRGTVNNPRRVDEVPQRVLTVDEIRARMPRKPVRRVQRVDSAPRRGE